MTVITIKWSIGIKLVTKTWTSQSLVGSIDWLIDWIFSINAIDRLIDWLIARLIDWLLDWIVDWLIDWALEWSGKWPLVKYVLTSRTHLLHYASESGGSSAEISHLGPGLRSECNFRVPSTGQSGLHTWRTNSIPHLHSECIPVESVPARHPHQHPGLCREECDAEAHQGRAGGGGVRHGAGRCGRAVHRDPHRPGQCLSVPAGLRAHQVPLHCTGASSLTISGGGGGLGFSNLIRRDSKRSLTLHVSDFPLRRKRRLAIAVHAPVLQPLIMHFPLPISFFYANKSH